MTIYNIDTNAEINAIDSQARKSRFDTVFSQDSGSSWAIRFGLRRAWPDGAGPPAIWEAGATPCVGATDDQEGSFLGEKVDKEKDTRCEVKWGETCGFVDSCTFSTQCTDTDWRKPWGEYVEFGWNLKGATVWHKRFHALFFSNSLLSPLYCFWNIFYFSSQPAPVLPFSIDVFLSRRLWWGQCPIFWHLGQQRDTCHSNCSATGLWLADGFGWKFEITIMCHKF